jgi:hypothetical protein
MKPASEVLGGARFRRLALPGLVLALGIHPYLMSLLGSWLTRTYAVSGPVLFVIEVALFGMLISSAVTPIYYLYEGFSQKWLTLYAKRLNHRRVESESARWRSLTATRDDLAEENEKDPSPEKERQLRAIEEQLSLVTGFLQDFPRLQTPAGPQYVAERPTLLGNVIASYELYAHTRYEIDGHTLWFHLLNLGPDSGRSSFEEKIDFAEGMVLASASGMVVALVGVVALGVGLTVGDSNVTALGVVEMVLGMGLFFLFYALAIPAHREAGTALRAQVDLAMPNLRKWLSEVEVPADPGDVDRIDAIVHYLRFLTTPR